MVNHKLRAVTSSNVCRLCINFKHGGSKAKVTRHFFSQSKTANILQEQSELSELIHDYFMDESCDDSGVELSEEEETPEQMDNDSVVNSNCDEEDHDAPLIHIDEAIGRTSCFTNNEAVNHPTLAQAAVFRCRCKQIKTIAEAGLEPDQRKGVHQPVHRRRSADFAAQYRRHDKR